MPSSPILRFSSRRQPLERSFLIEHLRNARSYDRIAGYFSSSLFEIAGEELDSVKGKIRVICNSNLHPQDVITAQAAKIAYWKSWTASSPEEILDTASIVGKVKPIQERFKQLFQLLSAGKLEVRVLPDEVFGLIHGKAGIITLANGEKTSFIGSANESKTAWRMNYELVWEDPSPESITWVQEEFDALWSHPAAFPLSEAIIQDIERLSKRQVLHNLKDWEKDPNPASPVIETPVYRKEAGLWEHQKYFVKLTFEAHAGPMQKARFVLADQVGLGKTIQLAMAAQLMALTGDKPILIICPKTLIWQWQDEMRDMLDMPSAVWDGKRWVDERQINYPVFLIEPIRNCPRRIGIISSGLIIQATDIVNQLLRLQYDCIILDEAHHARRRNLGFSHENDTPDPNNLLSFMQQIAPRTRSLLLATATPVQLRPIEAWDLLNILNQGDESVIGNQWSEWQNGQAALNLVMKKYPLPEDDYKKWKWMRNPLPPKAEGKDFAILRNVLNVPDDQAVVFGDHYKKLRPPDLSRLNKAFPDLIYNHNPFIQRIIRRTREQLEKQIDPETNEPLLKPIKVELLGEEEQDAVNLSVYLKVAYEKAEEFCEILGKRMQASGFLKTLLLRRMGSSIEAGRKTAERMLANWTDLNVDEDDDVSDPGKKEFPGQKQLKSDDSKTLTEEERQVLINFLEALKTNEDPDPKYFVILDCLKNRNWLEKGCIIFSQYRDSILWLGELLTKEFPKEPIALYSGPSSSGVYQDGIYHPATREVIKEKVRNGEIRLLLGTDAASEGLNLQRLSTLINLDLPWNPTRLEQRKGRIQRIGQIQDTVLIYNLRYKGSVEDRVHELLSSRLQEIYNLFGQIPDILEDVWVSLAQGEKEEAKRIIDELPKHNPFEIRNTKVEKVDWESCSNVLSIEEKQRILGEGWANR